MYLRFISSFRLFRISADISSGVISVFVRSKWTFSEVPISRLISALLLLNSSSEELLNSLSYAFLPTTLLLDLSIPKTEGVYSSCWAFLTISIRPLSFIATSELVVPRSIPILITLSSLIFDDLGFN